MTRMNPTDYYEIHMELIHAISSVWEFWLAVTFAVVVAFHIGRESTSRTLLWIGCTLYLAASVTAIIRYASYAGSIGAIRQELINAGVAPFPMPVSEGIAISVMTFITMVGGTIATVVFAVYQNRRASIS
jgi:hypothetical protein